MHMGSFPGCVEKVSEQYYVKPIANMAMSGRLRACEFENVKMFNEKDKETSENVLFIYTSDIGV